MQHAFEAAPCFCAKLVAARYYVLAEYVEEILAFTTLVMDFGQLHGNTQLIWIGA